MSPQELLGGRNWHPTPRTLACTSHIRSHTATEAAAHGSLFHDDMHAWPRCSAQRVERLGVVSVFFSKDGSSVGLLDGGAEGLIVGTLVGAADGLSVAQQGSQISRARIYIPAQAQARIKSQDQDSIFQLETILQSFNKAPRSEAKAREGKAAYSSVSLSGAALADLMACVSAVCSAPETVGVMAAPWARP